MDYNMFTADIRNLRSRVEQVDGIHSEVEREYMRKIIEVEQKAKSIEEKLKSLSNYDEYLARTIGVVSADVEKAEKSLSELRETQANCHGDHAKVLARNTAEIEDHERSLCEVDKSLGEIREMIDGLKVRMDEYPVAPINNLSAAIDGLRARVKHLEQGVKSNSASIQSLIDRSVDDRKKLEKLAPACPEPKSAQEISPCPKCGSHTVTVWHSGAGYFCECDACSHRNGKYFALKDAAIKVWNSDAAWRLLHYPKVVPPSAPEMVEIKEQELSMMVVGGQLMAKHEDIDSSVVIARALLSAGPLYRAKK